MSPPSAVLSGSGRAGAGRHEPRLLSCRNPTSSTSCRAPGPSTLARTRLAATFRRGLGRPTARRAATARYHRPMTEPEQSGDRRATRIERDSMGEMEVPADALYGASTQRAVLNFPISGQRMPRRFLRALALVKLAAAETNAGLGLLEPAKADAIAAAAARGRRRRLRRALPDRRLPDGLGHLDQHEHERGDQPPRVGAAGRGEGPPQRRRQQVPVLERHDPDGAPAVGRRSRSRRS